MDSELTFQWLMPIMIGLVSFLIGVIGYMIRGYLEKISRDLSSMNDEIKKYFKESDKRHHDTEIRIVKLEEHLLH